MGLYFYVEYVVEWDKQERQNDRIRKKVEKQENGVVNSDWDSNNSCKHWAGCGGFYAI